MKASLMAALFLSTLIVSQGQTSIQKAKTAPADTAYAVVERGANHRIWEKTSYEPGPNGQAVPKIHRYTELASGLHYKDANGQWAESKELIESFSGGAIARQGQYQVIFANNLNSYGAIDMQTPDGKRLRSNILGLMYYDTSTGDSVLIAELKDSAGGLISNNQVLYSDAFDGVKADVQYTYKRGGFEQDVILHEQPPTPESFGLNPATTELEVFTEFIDPPAASVTDGGINAQELESDQKISWGKVKLGRGKAFSIGAPNQVSVSKRYVTIQGRHFLLEKVPVKAVQKSLIKLPDQASNQRKLPYLASKELVLPQPRLAGQPKPMKLAKATTPEMGYVLDYVTVSSSYTDFTFQGDTTYLISGVANFDGTLTLEGGTVIKYDTRQPDGSIQAWCPVVCKTSAYRPAIFTSCNDDSVGESTYISGAPTYYDSVFSIDGPSAGGDISLQYLRISYTYWGLHPAYGTTFTLRNSQFVHCVYAFQPESMTCYFNNVLISDVGTAFNGADYDLIATHLTVDGCSNSLAEGWYDDPANCSVSLTNSLLVNVANNGSVSVTTNYTATIASGASVFQTVGGGAHYLAANSPYRNAGTTNIDSTLLADLAAKTTYPPVIYSAPEAYFGTSLDLYPRAKRDTGGNPDLGYHYDALDYLLGGMYVTNASIKINPGTAIGFYGTNYWTYGLAVSDNASLYASGAAGNLVHFTTYNVVQENIALNWKTPTYAIVTHFGGTNTVMNCRFVDWSVMANDMPFIQASGYDAYNYVNCQFHGGQIVSGYPTFNFTNCLLERVSCDIEIGDNHTPIFRNNLVFGGHFIYAPYNVDDAVVKDNLFDHAIIEDWLGIDGATYDGGHNAYVTNCDTLVPSATNDIILAASPGYQNGVLGDYYLPTNSPLINAGSATADQVGLYHFTTQTNQVKEANSTVDIGYHYVAVDSSGNPVDADGDGVADYLEDADGNGVYGAGDLSDWLLSPYNGLSQSSVLKVYTPLK